MSALSRPALAPVGCPGPAAETLGWLGGYNGGLEAGAAGGVLGCTPPAPARCRHLALVLLPGPVIHAAPQHSYLSGLIILININYSVN